MDEYLFGCLFTIFSFLFIVIIFVYGEYLLYLSNPFLFFLWKNFFAIAGLILLGLAVYIFIFYKPHPAEKHIKSYKKGKISRGEAIEKISSTLYNPRKENIPSSISSKIIEKRVQALRRRVKAETGLLEDSIEYFKTKSRLE